MEHVKEEVEEESIETAVCRVIINWILFFILAFSLTYMLVISLTYAIRPVVLEPVTLSGTPDDWVVFRYPTEKFPRFCLFPHIVGIQTGSEMIEMERGLWLRVADNQTYTEVIYQCNSFYNASVIVTITPTHAKSKKHLTPMEIGCITLVGCFGLMFLFYQIITITKLYDAQKRINFR